MAAACLIIASIAFRSAVERAGHALIKRVRAGSGVSGESLELRGHDFAPLFTAPPCFPGDFSLFSSPASATLVGKKSWRIALLLFLRASNKMKFIQYFRCHYWLVQQ
jgi:hypothetical protein